MACSPAMGRLLVRCAREHDWRRPLDGLDELAAHVPAQGLAAAADYHGITGCVYRSVTSSPLLRSPDLETAYRRRLGMHVRTLGDLAHLAPALEGLKVTWLILKGPVLAEGAYASPDLRGYNDLDLLVPPGRLGDVLDACERSGGRILDRNWRLLRTLKVSEILLRLRHGTLLDLHWHLLNGEPARRSFEIPVGEVMERARSVVIGGTVVRTPDPTDTLLHLGVHGCLSGGDRLVWLKDVDRTLATSPPPWDEVVDRARLWDVGPPLAVTLDRARRVLGAAVPEDLVPVLAGGRSWNRLANLADRISPVQRSVGSRSFSRMVSRSTKSGLGSSIRELGGHLAGALTEMNLSGTTSPSDTDPDSRGSLRWTGGPAGDRQEFLDAVARRDGVGEA